MSESVNTQNQPVDAITYSNQASASFYDLLRLVVVDKDLDYSQKKVLIDEIRKASPASDRWTFRWAIWILGIVVVIAIGTIGGLAAHSLPVPEGLVAIGSGAAGGIAGLLTPSKGKDSE
ncbi:MAG: hypothetical protein U1B30_12495 [Pseudomonadota bacterium]|nr:hypothetical protein [Pseudomonadota bacterium]